MLAVKFFKDDSDGRFVQFGTSAARFYLGNDKSNTFCQDLSKGFEGLEDTTLTGKRTYRERFACIHLVAIQLQ